MLAAWEIILIICSDSSPNNRCFFMGLFSIYSRMLLAIAPGKIL